MEMQFTSDAFDRGSAEYFVLRMDGLFVPFFWEEYRFKNHSTLILKLEECDTEASAKRLVGTDVFYPLSGLPEDEDEQVPDSFQALVGFRVKDAQGRAMGEIVRVDDSTANILLTISRPDGKELLLPYHDHFLLAYDFKRRDIQLEVPDGLLEMNE